MTNTDEQTDLDLAERIVFAGLPFRLERFTSESLNRGKTPDWRIIEAGVLRGYCEVKSPRDTWLDEELSKAPLGTIVGGLREDPTFNRIARQIERAEDQFNVVNPAHDVANVLVIVNHDEMSNFKDLRELLTGDFVAEGGNRTPTMPERSARLRRKMNMTDLIIWIDAERLWGGTISIGAKHPALVDLLKGNVRDFIEAHAHKSA